MKGDGGRGGRFFQETGMAERIARKPEMTKQKESEKRREACALSSIRPHLLHCAHIPATEAQTNAFAISHVMNSTDILEADAAT